LIGKVLMRTTPGGILAARIVETEAYLDRRDPASHSYRGRTPRNDVMFRDGGLLYVYFTYGMHFCCNVVTETEGKGSAVLLRAAEPMEGIETLARNRKFPPADLESLCSGPAKLCQAFGIGRAENGIDLTGDEIWIARDERSADRWRIVRSPRVGIRNGREHLWRYSAHGNRFVSKPPATRATSRGRSS
jgi:DNA-3-methyladenine glycosylase